MESLLYIGIWLYAIFKAFSGGRIKMAATGLIVGIAVLFTPLRQALGIYTLPLFGLLVITILIVNQFDGALRQARMEKAKKPSAGL